jgi:hypothetical protein
MSKSKIIWAPPQIIWTAVITVVVWSALGFSWFGIGFDWETQGGAKHLSTNVMKDSYATICVAQARSAPDSESTMKEFAALDKWKQRDYVENAGWAVMPGSEKEVSGVATECVAKLRQT